MSDATPVLEMRGARPHTATGQLSALLLDFRVMPGQCIVIEVQDATLAAEFVDLCCGLLLPLEGQVRFLGHDWSAVSYEHAAAMRGHIGRTYGANSWISFLGTDQNILWPQLHHTRRPEPMLRETAAELARSFGLPGLPLTSPDGLTRGDLVRADCVRAFLGDPRLVIIESAALERVANLEPALLNALTATRDPQTCSIWLAPGDSSWKDRAFPATMRLRLTEHGLVPTGALP
jgi:phospholipid/cholesterol/gamma-HCH transport system ATP-binding protein